MLERKNDSLYLISLLLLSAFIGCSSSYFLHLPSILAFLLSSILITLFMYSICLCIFRIYKKHSIFTVYRSYLARGSYKEIADRIDADGKEMQYLWEFKLLALFHSGNISEFKRLYRNYMNEVNECATLLRYKISLLQDVLLAIESPNKPVRFLKNSGNVRHSYTKNIEYQLYQNIYMGLKEYYQPQRNLVKVYFEKFLQQAQNISRPLSFYLHYLMTLTMFENDHPLCEPYANRTQSFIFDDTSLQLVNQNITPRIDSMQKGLGYQENMDRQRGRRDYQYDIDPNAQYEQPFDMRETGFRTTPKKEEGFMKKRHASEFQSDFDALNASVQDNNTFNLYEDNEYDEIAPRQRFRQEAPTPIQPQQQEEDVNVDLDPTWFARSMMQDDEPIVTANFSMRNPHIQDVQPLDSPSYQNRSNREDMYPNTQTYQEPIMNANPSTQVEPEFMNTNNFMEQRLAREQQRPVMNTTRAQMMNQAQARPQHIAHPQQAMQSDMNRMQQNPSQMQAQRIQQPSMMHQDVVNTPQDRFSRFQQQRAPQTQIQDQRELVKQPQRNERKFLSREKRNTKQDPFGFDNPNAITKEPYLQETVARNQKKQRSKQQANIQETAPRSEVKEHSYKAFVRRNLAIAGMTLLNAVVISIASSSFVYTKFFDRYPINSNMITDIVLSASIVAILMTYLIAGIHTGWTILKKPISNWSKVAVFLTSPFLLIAAFLIGAVCEFPYLLYASIKARNEKAIDSY